MDPDATDEFVEFLRDELVRRDRHGGAVILGQPFQVSLDQRTDPCAECDLVTHGWRSAGVQRLDECILGQFAVLVELVGEAASLNDPSDAVAVAIPASRQPRTIAELCAADVAVLPDPQ